MGLFIIQTVYHVLSIILLHNATMKYKIIYFVLVTDYTFRNHGVKRMLDVSPIVSHMNVE